MLATSSHSRAMDTAMLTHDIFWVHAWELSGHHYRLNPGSATNLTEDHVRSELLFCLLGGQAISYDLNRSAADRLAALGVFGARLWLEQEIRSELELPQFEPRRRDGGPRRYRFPARKAALLAGAAAWISERRPLSDLLSARPSERERRALLMDCPGLGPKSASWLLRNLGLGHRLAILDIHVLRAMTACGRLTTSRLPQDYERAEIAYLNWCDELEVEPGGFDLLLWDWSRQR